MKCKECKNEMVEWQRSKHTGFIQICYRCEVCGYEGAPDIIYDKPKDLLKEPPKKDKD